MPVVRGVRPEYSRRFLLCRRFTTDCYRVLRAPAHQRLPPLLGGGVGTCALRVLTYELKLSAAFKGDCVPGDHPRVGDLGDPAVLGLHPVLLSGWVERLVLLVS